MRDEGRGMREEGQGMRDKLACRRQGTRHKAKDKGTKLNFQLFLSKYGNILQIHRL
jgi:hypothetical protein